MTWKTALVVLLLQFLLLSVQPLAALGESTMDEVRAAVSAFGRAFVQADVRYLRSRLTEDYVHINGRSGELLHRDAWLDWVDSRRAELASGMLVVSHYRIESVVVKIYGSTAVVTGVVESGGTRGGNPFGSRVRFTNVWSKQGHTWRRAAFHDSPLIDP